MNFIAAKQIGQHCPGVFAMLNLSVCGAGQGTHVAEFSCLAVGRAHPAHTTNGRKQV